MVADEALTGADEDADRCLVCGGHLTARKLKKHCDTCGTLCETCCDGGRA